MATTRQEDGLSLRTEPASEDYCTLKKSQAGRHVSPLSTHRLRLNLEEQARSLHVSVA